MWWTDPLQGTEAIRNNKARNEQETSVPVAPLRVERVETSVKGLESERKGKVCSRDRPSHCIPLASD